MPTMTTQWEETNFDFGYMDSWGNLPGICLLTSATKEHKLMCNCRDNFEGTDFKHHKKLKQKAALP